MHCRKVNRHCRPHRSSAVAGLSKQTNRLLHLWIFWKRTSNDDKKGRKQKKAKQSWNEINLLERENWESVRKSTTIFSHLQTKKTADRRRQVYNRTVKSNKLTVCSSSCSQIFCSNKANTLQHLNKTMKPQQQLPK